MGALQSPKKVEKLEINYFLFENYKKYLKIDSNLIDFESLPENIEAIGSSFSLCCCHYSNYSADWKEHFFERTSRLKEKFLWVAEIRSFVKKIPSLNDEAFVSRFSWKMFLTLNKEKSPFQNDLISPISLDFSAPSYRSNCLLIETSPFQDKGKRRRTISSSGSRMSKGGLPKKFTPNSFFSSKSDLFVGKEEMNKNYVFLTNVYKIVTEELESQLNDKMNSLGALRLFFLSNLLKKLDASKDENNIENIENLIQGIKFFIRIFTECLMIFYKLEDVGEYVNKSFKTQTSAFKFDNFYILITNLIFNDEIFDRVLALQEKIDLDEAKSFIEGLERSKEKSIEDFEIPVQFALNENTAINILKQPYKLGLISPYDDLIKMLKNIDSLKSPFFQFKLLNMISESITREINEFYENFQNSFSESIDTDTLISIHIYIIAKSGVKELASYLNLIEKFSTEKQKMELSGYYLTIFRASIEFIKEK